MLFVSFELLTVSVLLKTIQRKQCFAVCRGLMEMRLLMGMAYAETGSLEWGKCEEKKRWWEEQ